MPGRFDQDGYWIARHDRLGADPRSVGNAGKSLAENLAGEDRLRAMLATALRLLPASGRALDIGCGNGRLSPVFCDAGLDYTGLDVSPRATAAAAVREPRGRFITGSALAADWGGGFDLVAVIYVFVHFVDDADWRRLLGRIAASLRPGGLLLFADQFPACAARPAAHVRERPLSAYAAEFPRIGLVPDDEFPRRMAAEGHDRAPFALARRGADR